MSKFKHTPLPITVQGVGEVRFSATVAAHGRPLVAVELLYLTEREAQWPAPGQGTCGLDGATQRITEEWLLPRTVFNAIRDAEPGEERTTPLGLSPLFDAARTHGEDSEAEHEVGDLQSLLMEAWSLLSVEARGRLVKSDAAQAVLEWSR